MLAVADIERPPFHPADHLLQRAHPIGPRQTIGVSSSTRSRSTCKTAQACSGIITSFRTSGLRDSPGIRGSRGPQITAPSAIRFGARPGRWNGAVDPADAALAQCHRDDLT
jgi:hypothetical protein